MRVLVRKKELNPQSLVKMSCRGVYCVTFSTKTEMFKDLLVLYCISSFAVKLFLSRLKPEARRL